MIKDYEFSLLFPVSSEEGRPNWLGEPKLNLLLPSQFSGASIFGFAVSLFGFSKELEQMSSTGPLIVSEPFAGDVLLVGDCRLFKLLAVLKTSSW